MLYSVGSSLPEHRIKAFIETDDPENRIHDDEYARHYGFRSGLVPGVFISAYMSRPLVELMGREWLERGSAEVRFIRPVYEGEEIRVSGTVTSMTKDGTLLLDYQASNNQGAVCGIGTAKLPQRVPAPEPKPDDYPKGRRKLRRPISLKSLKVGENLTPITSQFTWNVHWQYCRKLIRDHNPMYERTLHPGWLVSRASRILADNYAIGAWIDVSCQAQHFHLQEEECKIETRGRVQAKYEHKGDHYIELDLAVFAPTRCLATIRYTAIFRIAPNAA
jgi:acyl dehydratase